MNNFAAALSFAGDTKYAIEVYNNMNLVDFHKMNTVKLAYEFQPYKEK